VIGSGYRQRDGQDLLPTDFASLSTRLSNKDRTDLHLSRFSSARDLCLTPVGSDFDFCSDPGQSDAVVAGVARVMPSRG
jgi:hypothetical protein